MKIIALNKSNLLFLTGMAFYAIFLPHLVVNNYLGYFLILIVVGAALLLGIRYLLLGLLLVFTTMNSFFNLVPTQILSGAFINKTWDLGFFLLIIIASFIFFKRSKSIRTINMPLYFKIFIFYLIICAFSFLLTIIKYPFPILDTIRSFRYHLGYFFIPVLLIYFLQTDSNDEPQKFYSFLTALYYISFSLLTIYIIQFLIQKQIFTGYSGSLSIEGSSYLRSIPNFMFLCYFFLWYNLSAWLTSNKMYPAGMIYILFCFAATAFTFTRGLYLSVTLTTIILIFLLFKNRKLSLDKLIVSAATAFVIISLPLLTGDLTPFLTRASTINEAAMSGTREGTFWYRIDLLEDRIRLANKENPLIGIGFVHNKYGYKFGNFRGNYDESIDGPGLGCADIAWANIAYRTGWAGIGSFTVFIFFLFYYIIKHLGSKKTIDSLFLLETAALFELLRQVAQMLNSDTFTGGSIQNIAFLLSIAIFLHYKNSNNNKVKSC